jgi:serine/threonine protein kinase
MVYMLYNKGLAKISDFGFARAVHESRIGLDLTLLGTPAYMSPQILLGGVYIHQNVMYFHLE